MTKSNIALPEIVSRDEWLVARKELLAREKEATRMRDAVNAERRRLPMVKITKNYVFEGPDASGKASLLDLFDGRRQLLVHHFMWIDEPDEGCPGCSAEADINYNPAFFAEMHKRDVTVAAVSRAPLAKIERFKTRKGWTFPWYSSHDSDFNYDFHATIDKDRGAVEFNYQEVTKLGGIWEGFEGDLPCKSVFLRYGETVFHAYSAYARGLDQIATPYNYLDLTPYGRPRKLSGGGFT